MSSSVVVLRAMCKANGLGTSGSSTVLLARLLAGNKKKDAIAKKEGATKKHKEKNVKKQMKHVKKATAKAAALFKGVKGGGERLSAASYFKNIAELYNCKPQWIRQPNGSVVLKKIKMCDDAWGGRCAKWVKA